jgi:hypothetical protein
MSSAVESLSIPSFRVFVDTELYTKQSALFELSVMPSLKPSSEPSLMPRWILPQCQGLHQAKSHLGIVGDTASDAVFGIFVDAVFGFFVNIELYTKQRALFKSLVMPSLKPSS